MKVSPQSIRIGSRLAWATVYVLALLVQVESLYARALLNYLLANGSGKNTVSAMITIAILMIVVYKMIIALDGHWLALTQRKLLGRIICPYIY